MNFLGLIDAIDRGGTDPRRFLPVDGSTDGIEFYERRGVLPWTGNEPNDNAPGVGENCVEYVFEKSSIMVNLVNDL